MRQGPHQGAQKSTSTGLSDLRTSVSKFESVTSIGFAMFGFSFFFSRLQPEPVDNFFD